MRHLLIIFLLLLSFTLFPQGRINRMKNMQRQGKWIICRDSTKQIDQTGRYRNGDQKGTWEFYDANGNLAKKETYRNKKIKFTFYYPNGKIKKQGKAKYIRDDKIMHFYYYGTWF